jgi:L-aspartate oxidase
MADVVVVGSGIAGLFIATRCARAGLDTIVVTKKNLSDSSTNWAQGGIAAALDPDDVEAHIADTIAAGGGLCDEDVVRFVVEESNDRIKDLIESGVQFDKDGDEFDLAMEGGHSSRRILHAKDATGAEIERALIAEARASLNLELLESHMAIDIIVEKEDNLEINADNFASPMISLIARGLWLLKPTGDVEAIQARHVILATGGAGQIYRDTTNPLVATGDGMAMAYRAGAEMGDMEFVQFHPTALKVPGERPFLISEAVRGHGGVLLTAKDSERLLIENSGLSEVKNPKEFSFMLKYDNRGSLATRDIVARAIEQEMQNDGEESVGLHTFHLDTNEIQEKFPTIQARLNQLGATQNKEPLQLGEDPLPVAPAAHYFVGGVRVTSEGVVYPQSSEHLPSRFLGLYAIGEVASTGLHGANRLASNSLLEAVVYSQRCVETVKEIASQDLAMAPLSFNYKGLYLHTEEWDNLIQHESLDKLVKSLQQLMTEDVGIVKHNRRLEGALLKLKEMQEQVQRIWKVSRPTQELIELRNMIQVGILVTEAALKREENVGLHYKVE